MVSSSILFAKSMIVQLGSSEDANLIIKKYAVLHQDEQFLRTPWGIERKRIDLARIPHPKAAITGLNFWAVVVAQMVERSLPAPEIRSLNPNMGKILSTDCTLK